MDNDSLPGCLVIALAVFLVLGCTERVVYVYADAATPPGDAAAGSDGPTHVEDASEAVDANVAAGACMPHRAPGAISQMECLRDDVRPICDALSERCVEPPTELCGACTTDEQCRGVDLYARCAFIPGDVQDNDDQACLVPCAGHNDCAWLREMPGWTTALCHDLPSGSFCLPDYGGVGMCRDGSGLRL